MVRGFGATERQVWRDVLLPGALPAIVTGLRLGLGRAFTGMVAVELLLVAVGVGRLIVSYQGEFDGAAVYAVVLLLVAEAVTCLHVLKRLEQRFVPWADRVGIE
jgi:NitT/TauT family transport system permease protein